MQEIVGMTTNALVLASMYILVTLGFAFLFNMLGIFNFAHGAIYMLGAYVGFALISVFGLNRYIGLILAAVVLLFIGLFVARFFFRPYVGDFNRILMGCVAITMILQTSVNIAVGSQYLALPPFLGGMFKLGIVEVSNERVFTFGVGIVLLALVIWFVYKTKWGQQMQAIAQDLDGARLLGINVNRILAIATALGFAIASVAGCLLGAYTHLGPFMGEQILVKVLIIAILAGAGNIGGICITGLILGILDSVLPLVLPMQQSSLAANAITSVVVVVLILIRPQGLFGHEA